MKTSKRLLSLMCLVMALAMVLCACAQPAAQAPAQTEAPAAAPATEAPAAEAPVADAPAEDMPAFKIGLIAYTNAGLWWDRVNEAVNTVAKSLNCEVVIAWGDVPDASIAAVENLCAAGVDGIVHLSTAGVTPRLVEICEAKGVYLAGAYNDCGIDQGYDAIAANPYWAGYAYADEYQTSYNVAQEMIDNGAKNFVIFGLPPGVSTSFDLRANGAMDAVEANGLTLMAEARSFAMPEIAQSFLTQYPDADAIYSIVCASTYITNPIMAAGKAGKLQVMTYDDETDTAGAFEAGLLTHATEGANAQAQVAFALVYNALRGNRIADAAGNAPAVLLPYCHIRTADEYNEFLSFSTGGATPYSADEIKQMIVAFNSAASADSIAATAGAFSMDDLRARH